MVHNMNKKLETELENLKRTDQISDWSVTLGYGDAEYTIEFHRNKIPNLKSFAIQLQERHSAHTFGKFVDGSITAMKFVVNI